MDALSTTAQFGQRVKRELRVQDISLRELAARMDEYPSSVSRKLVGKRPLTLEEAARIARELNVPLSALLP